MQPGGWLSFGQNCWICCFYVHLQPLFATKKSGSNSRQSETQFALMIPLQSPFYLTCALFEKLYWFGSDSKHSSSVVVSTICLGKQAFNWEMLFGTKHYFELAKWASCPPKNYSTAFSSNLRLDKALICGQYALLVCQTQCLHISKSNF